jgi:hypothetical protein
MKKLVISIPVILGIIFILSCDKLGNSKKDLCAEDKTTSYVYLAYPWLEPNFNMQVDPDDSRVFQVWTVPYENICPDEHILIEITGTITPRPDKDLRFRVEYRYGAFGVFGNSYEMAGQEDIPNNQKTFSGQTWFGIKNAYDAEPGSFYLNFEWYLYGDNEDELTDLAYFQQFTVNFKITLEYHLYEN